MQGQEVPSLVSDSRTCFGRACFFKFMDEFENKGQIKILRYISSSVRQVSRFNNVMQGQEVPSLVSDSRTCFGRACFFKFMDEFENKGQIKILRYISSSVRQVSRFNNVMQGQEVPSLVSDSRTFFGRAYFFKFMDEFENKGQIKILRYISSSVRQVSRFNNVMQGQEVPSLVSDSRTFFGRAYFFKFMDEFENKGQIKILCLWLSMT